MLTFSNIYKVLNDSKFRSFVLNKINSEILINFWNNEFNKAGDYQRVKIIQGVVSKLSKFILSDTALNIFELNKNIINFDELINNQRILICYLPKGLLGEDLSSLIGSIIISRIHSSSLSRQKTKSEERKDFYLYIDEFQNFNTNMIAQMLAEVRKYKVIINLIEQSPSQQDRDITSRILANIGNLAIFKITNPLDQKIMINFLKPSSLVKSDLSDLDPFSYYFKWQFKSNQKPVTVKFENPYLK